jgi:RNA polymerase sigma-70 factor (ECF subfamily)
MDVRVKPVYRAVLRDGYPQSTAVELIEASLRTAAGARRVLSTGRRDVTDLEAWLVLRAQSGDRKALETLLEGVEGALHRYVLRWIGNRPSADDVLQEVLVRIYRKLPWLDDPALFRPWAYRIASREAFRFLAKQQQSQARTEDDASLESMPDTSTESLEGSDLERLVEQASPASRAVLILHYQHDLTIDEVAAVLGIAPGTVKSRLAYGLRRLREGPMGRRP